MAFKKGNIPWNRKPQKKVICKECGNEIYMKQSSKRTLCNLECKHKYLSKKYKGKFVEFVKKYYDAIEPSVLMW